MPRIHPKPGLLEGLTGALPEARRRILRHLHDCPVCQAQPAEPPGERLLSFPSQSRDYDAVLERVLRAFRPRLAAAEREREAAPALFSELLSHPPERQQLLLRNSRRFQSSSLCFFVLGRSREEIRSNPRRGEDLAVLALNLCDWLDPEEHVERIEDLRAQGWMLIANARRMHSDLRGSEMAFLQAEAHLRKGSRDRLYRADFLSLKAALRRAQSRFTESVRLARRAFSIWLVAGEGEGAVRALASWAASCGESGDLNQEILLLKQAATLAGPNPDLRLRVVLQHNLAACLIDKGCLLEARAVLARSLGLYNALRDPIIDLRRRWLWAEIAHGLGRLEEAAELLISARDGFVEQDDGVHAALIALELAQVHAETGRFEEAEEEAEQALSVFRSQRVLRESLAALALLQQVAARRPPVSLAS